MENYKHVVVPFVNSVMKDVFTLLESGMRTAKFKLSDATLVLSGVDILIVVLVQALNSGDIEMCVRILKELSGVSDWSGVSDTIVLRLRHFLGTEQGVYQAARAFAHSLVTRDIVEVPENLLQILEDLSVQSSCAAEPSIAASTSCQPSKTVQPGVKAQGKKQKKKKATVTVSTPTTSHAEASASSQQTVQPGVKAQGKKEKKKKMTVMVSTPTTSQALASASSQLMIQSPPTSSGQVWPPLSQAQAVRSSADVVVAQEDLWDAVDEGDLPSVREALQRGARGDVVGGNGVSPLHQAALRGELGVIRCLLDAGGDVDVRNGGGQTALHWAAIYNQLEAAQLLVARGAEVNPRMSGNFTPLSLSLINSHPSLASFLHSVGGVE